MKRNLFFLVLIFGLIPSFAQWKPAGDKLKTTWAEKIDVNNVLPEYPRPILDIFSLKIQRKQPMSM
jgi:hypothetical protein